ncbi:MAG: penicillin-binding protein 2 [Candidatus Peribacteraceae bacterium]|nr:penicillin-binding protein 2 [Candidatus Peribacteraceae bacterium]
MSSYRLTQSETQRTRSLKQRMLMVHVFLLLCGLVIVARLIELQILRGNEFYAYAQAQHYGGVVLPARRGEILAQSSKTNETRILATNTTLDLVYVDPLVLEDPVMVAEKLADILVTQEFHADCSAGKTTCPRELMGFYASAFDQNKRIQELLSTTLLEPLPTDLPPPPVSELPDLTEVRRLFARSIESRIGEKRVTFVPLVYGANKVQMQTVEELGIAGIDVNKQSRLISADPEKINQGRLADLSRKLSEPLALDQIVLQNLLRSRPLRYVSIMHRLPPALSARMRDLQLTSLQETLKRKKEAATTEAAELIKDPLRSIALLPEHWRFYPDGTVASQVVGFLNPNQEAQYGIERTFDPQLRGQEGLISTVSDPSGGQILTADQRIIDPKDGDTVVLTIDRSIQEAVEGIMEKAVKNSDSDSGQAIVMDPSTGRIIAMVNAPIFDSNNYGEVYGKEPMILSEDRRRQIVVEIYHPDTRAFILKAYIDDVFTTEGRSKISDEKQKMLTEIEKQYDLKDIVRYYYYFGETTRIEIFPTDRPDVWLKFKNGIGVGAYLNRNVQAVYEPGSVMKPVTMAIAIDQGEVTPADIYDDNGPVKVDEYTIQNALFKYYGKVTMTNCLEFSINTCMTSVSTKLGRKLFYRALDRFGFGHITGIELEDELPGELPPWRNWSNSLLATAAYGQGVSATPLQMLTAFAALANGGKLMKPTIIDRIIHTDGSVERTQTKILDQVITPESSATITAMLVSSATKGYAKSAKVPGYRIAGKTGTSQVAGPGGKYETGTGSVITSFAGYAPVNDPKFVVLVKFDRPKAHGSELGVQSAAPVFKDIAAFMFKYYGIPPDDK